MMSTTLVNLAFIMVVKLVAPTLKNGCLLVPHRIDLLLKLVADRLEFLVPSFADILPVERSKCNRDAEDQQKIIDDEPTVLRTWTILLYCCGLLVFLFLYLIMLLYLYPQADHSIES